MPKLWGSVRAAGIRRIRDVLIAAAALFAVPLNAAFAQDQIMKHGQLAVTGYSGATAAGAMRPRYFQRSQRYRRWS